MKVYMAADGGIPTASFLCKIKACRLFSYHDLVTKGRAFTARQAFEQATDENISRSKSKKQRT